MCWGWVAHCNIHLCTWFNRSSRILLLGIPGWTSMQYIYYLLCEKLHSNQCHSYPWLCLPISELGVGSFLRTDNPLTRESFYVSKTTCIHTADQMIPWQDCFYWRNWIQCSTYSTDVQHQRKNIPLFALWSSWKMMWDHFVNVEDRDTFLVVWDNCSKGVRNVKTDLQRLSL